MTQLHHLLAAALRRHLAGGKPTVPEAGRDLWRIFVGLSATRTYHMAGPNPISFAEIEAYARLHSWPLKPHHVETIRAMDNAWLEHAYREQEGTKGGKTVDGRRPASAQPMTAQSFDAVFG